MQAFTFMSSETFEGFAFQAGEKKNDEAGLRLEEPSYNDAAKIRMRWSSGKAVGAALSH